MAKPLEYEASVPMTQQAMPSKASTFEMAGSLFDEVSKGALKIARKQKHTELLAQQYATSGDMLENINKFAQESALIPNASDAKVSFDTKSKAYLDETFKNVNPQNLGVLKQKARGYLTNAHISMDNRIVRQQKNDANLEFHKQLNILSNESVNEAAKGNLGSALHLNADVHNMTNDAVERGFISPQAGATIQQHNYKGVLEQAVIAEYTNAKTVKGKNKALKKLDTKLYDDNFLPHEKDNIKRSLQKINMQNVLIKNFGVATSSEFKKKLTFKLRNGYIPTGADIALIHQTFPKRQGEFDLLIQDNMVIGSMAGTVKYGTIHDMEKRKEFLGRPENNDTFRKHNISSAAIGLIQNNQDKFIKDPYGESIKSPELQKIIVKAQHQKEQGNIYAPTPAEVATNWQRGRGISASNAQVQSQSQNLADISIMNSGDIPHAITFLKEKNKEYPRTFNLYLRGVSGKNGINGSFKTAYLMSTSTESATAIPDFIKAYSTPAQELDKQYTAKINKETVTPIMPLDSMVLSQMSNVNSALRSSTTNNQSTIDYLSKDIATLAKYWVVSGKYKDKEAVKEATDVIVKNRYHEINPKDHYLVPNKVNPDQLKNTFNRIDLAFRNGDFPIDSLSSQNPLISKDLKGRISLHDAVNPGHWANWNVDNEYIRVDVLNYPILYKGKPIVVYGEHLNSISQAYPQVFKKGEIVSKVKSKKGFLDKKLGIGVESVGKEPGISTESNFKLFSTKEDSGFGL